MTATSRMAADQAVRALYGYARTASDGDVHGADALVVVWVYNTAFGWCGEDLRQALFSQLRRKPEASPDHSRRTRMKSQG
jgi:hypothetical protein